MIIGGNNNLNKNPFRNNNNLNKNLNYNNNNGFINNNQPKQPISQNPYKDINNTQEMRERSFEILQQRYNDGLISIEEFSKKCENLRKQNKY